MPLNFLRCCRSNSNDADRRQEDSFHAQSDAQQFGTTITIQALLEPHDLFDMTAFDHGISKSTTTQEKRLKVVSNGSSNARDDSNKRRRIMNSDVGTKHPEPDVARSEASNEETKVAPEGETDQKPNSKGSSGKGDFRMTKWDHNDFFSFLASADAEMTGLTISNESDSASFEVQEFQSTMAESMRNQEIGNEPAMESRIMTRFKRMQAVFDARQVSDEYKELFLGRKSEVPKNYLKTIGPDNAVDMIFAHNRQQGQPHTALVPMEIKVSWNFPGGSLTSQEQDYARLGRDLKLYDLEPDKSFPSPADRNSAGPPGIENPTEGEVNVEAVLDVASNDESAANTSGSNHRPQLGMYTMKHEVFPVRQIVSYMLSMKTRYGILSTGYRFDFIKLEVIDRSELVVHIAGPFWSVKQLNTGLTSYRRRKDKEVETKYYSFIHRYPDVNVSIFDPDAWTTKIGDYPFLVGLFRFFFAASRLVDCDDGHESQLGDIHEDICQRGDAGNPCSNQENRMASQQQRPRSSMHSEMPEWYNKYARRSTLRQPNKGAKEYEDICKGIGPFSFTNDGERESYIKTMKEHYQCDWRQPNHIVIVDEEKESLWKPKLTRFGPLTLAELDGSKPEAIGFGRIGDAFRVKLGSVDVVCKLLNRSSWADKQYNIRISELKHEAEVYEVLLNLQGTVIPRFLYAGSIVNASYWLVPESGEILTFATTYEGRSLGDAVHSQYAQGFRLKASVRDQAFADLKAIHEAGVVHGDLVLRNLVFDGKKIKYIDFGNARLKSAYGPDNSFEQDKSRDLKQLKSVLCKIRWLEEDEEHLQECAPTRK